MALTFDYKVRDKSGGLVEGQLEGDSMAPLPARPTSIKNLEWERIHETLVETDFNISETARRLGLHRRTLARKLEKRKLT